MISSYFAFTSASLSSCRSHRTGKSTGSPVFVPATTVDVGSSNTALCVCDGQHANLWPHQQHVGTVGGCSFTISHFRRSLPNCPTPIRHGNADSVNPLPLIGVYFFEAFAIVFRGAQKFLIFKLVACCGGGWVAPRHVRRARFAAVENHLAVRTLPARTGRRHACFIRCLSRISTIAS